MKQYLNILKTINEYGTVKRDRTGTGTKSIFGHQERYRMKHNNNTYQDFPLVTTKKTFLRGIIHEVLWFLNGDTNIKYLVDNNVKIWNEWAWKDYKEETGEDISLEDFVTLIEKDENEFAYDHGHLGPVYGYQWRSWSTSEKNEDGWLITIDQITQAIERLKSNPKSRRHLVTAWNPAEVEQMALPPCHCLFQFNTSPMTLDERYEEFSNNAKTYGFDSVQDREELTDEDAKKILDKFNVPHYHLDCQLYQRSADVFLGVPFNIASYALLTIMMAQQVNMVARDFIHTMGDAHIYSNHEEQVALQLSREPKELPSMKIDKAEDLFSYKIEDFHLENYSCHPTIKGEVSI